MLAPVQANDARGASQTERRQGARQRLTMRVAKLRCCGGEYVCIIHDVSETGVRLRLFHAHPPDAHMYLELANGDFYAIERRWVDGEFAGCRFSSRVDVDEFLGESGAPPRRPVRLRVACPVRVVAAGEPCHAYMVNLSAHGACIEAGRQFAVGSPLRLEFAGFAPRLASVCWRQDFRHGLALQEVFRLDGLARLALAFQPFDAGPAIPALSGEARAIGV